MHAHTHLPTHQREKDRWRVRRVLNGKNVCLRSSVNKGDHEQQQAEVSQHLSVLLINKRMIWKSQLKIMSPN